MNVKIGKNIQHVSEVHVRRLSVVPLGLFGLSRLGCERILFCAVHIFSKIAKITFSYYDVSEKIDIKYIYFITHRMTVRFTEI